jgi:glycosyltransferase involved in cell wall biosynthesis
MVSIVMPLRNQARFLGAALESVLGQSHNDLELIVADGGSTDGSEDILRSYAAKDPRLRWSSRQDPGPAQALNRAVREARGDILGWLNADDLYAPDAIASAVDFFRDSPDALMVYGQADFIDTEGNVTGRYPTKPAETPVSAFADGCFICQPSVFMRREAWNRWGGLDESLRTSFDFDLWLRAFQRDAPRIGFIDKELAFSRRHESTITARERKHVALEGITILRRHLGKTPAHWVLNHMEEIMVTHPDVSEPNLDLRIRRFVEEAKPLMFPEEYAEVSRRIVADRRLALANSSTFVDVYPDGWAGERLRVRCRSTTPRRWELRCRSGLPRGQKHHVAVTSNGGSREVHAVRGGKSFQIGMTSREKGQTMFVLESDATFVPAERGNGSDDHRHLSFEVLELLDLS